MQEAMCKEQNLFSIYQTQKKHPMNTNDKNFQEQDHPLKNTDHAFVQVGKSGEPVIPKETADQRNDEKEENNTTTIEHR
jgi:hypothetical protein